MLPVYPLFPVWRAACIMPPLRRNYQCLPLIMPHFVDRFNIQPFILHDKTHHVAGVFDRKEWVIASAEGLSCRTAAPTSGPGNGCGKRSATPLPSGNRENPAARMNHMPKKYWKNMVEMTLPPHSGRHCPADPSSCLSAAHP